MSEFKIRKAKIEDSSLILSFIKKIAEYEKLTEQVVATGKLIEESLFKKKLAHCLIGEFEGKPVGFALYFYNFSTFIGKAGLYLEDLFIDVEYRKRGYGLEFFKELAKIARKEGCERMEWSCLNWNKPSIDFYLSLGAKPMDEWCVYRLDKEGLANFGLQKN